MTVDLRTFVEHASRRIERIFERTQQVWPIYHIVDASGEETILPAPPTDKCLGIAIMKAYFAIHPTQPARVLLRNEPDPGREVSPRSENVGIGNAGDQGRGQNWANARNLVEPPAHLAGAVPGGDAPIETRTHALLTDWLHALIADRPQKMQRGVTRACGAVMPDLKHLP